MDTRDSQPGQRRDGWVWVVLALVLGAAVWHVVDFESDLDGEYPAVLRPTYGVFPPAAYRLAEPGDTLDRVSLYLSSLLAAGSVVGMARAGRGRRLPWLAALGSSLLVWWYTASPGPSLDGWHTLGWRSMADAQAPLLLRIVLAAAFGGLLLMIIVGAVAALRSGKAGAGQPATTPRSRTQRALLVVAVALTALRLIDPPALAPAGYWSRFGLLAACLAALMALILEFAKRDWQWTRSRRWAATLAGGSLAGALILGGLAVVEFHRPIPRLKAAVPGKIYISAMPDYRGLRIAHQRHQFKTIINLFDESGPQRSPLWPQELAFVRDHPDITYLRSPVASEDDGAFLDQTLAVAQDPSAWPILVHCHGCMDRTPAWLGIYRFVVQGWSLTQVFREIEAHRGYRPKSSVTLLFNHVLPTMAKERYAADPVSAQIAEAVAGVADPYLSRRERELADSCPIDGDATARRDDGNSVQ